MQRREITAPFDAATVDSLKAGELVEITGTLIGARDAAHKRLVEAMDRGEALPVELAGQVIYYVAPAPAPPGHAVGSAGPTTSGRMDPYTERMLEAGVKGFIGKGYRSDAVKAALVRHKAVYLAAVGGAAALLAQTIRRRRVLAYEDLEPEAIVALDVERFPAIVINDAHGGDAYAAGQSAYRAKGEAPE